MTNALLAHLRELEVSLHQPGTRHDAAQLRNLLHDDFAEFGRSGNSYAKADIGGGLPQGDIGINTWSQDFVLAALGDDFALLTYKSAQVGKGGELFRHTLRSSVWQRTGSGWQLRFHQGTPTDAFP